VLVRNPEGDAVRSLYLTNSILKTIVEHNDYTRLRIINCGTKVFTKQDGGKGMDSSFRVLGEGLPVVLPYIDPDTIMDCDIGILRTLLSVYYPLCATFPEPFKSTVEARGKGCFSI
jgi:multisite-specific tRNA:(cytosine-C5)-methyltransferase